MDKKEVGNLLNYVSAGYPHFLRDNDPSIVFDLWHRALKGFEFDSVLENFIQYSLGNEYPPKIKDLVNGLAVNGKHNIPGIEETKKILDGYMVSEEERSTDDFIQELKKKYWSNRHE